MSFLIQKQCDYHLHCILYLCIHTLMCLDYYLQNVYNRLLLRVFLTLSMKTQVYADNTMPGPQQTWICWTNIAK